MFDKRIIIVGAGASGKDHLSHKLSSSLGLIKSTPITTRPKRENELDGQDYHFLNSLQFRNFIEKREVFLNQDFCSGNETWSFGILEEDWDERDIFILTPEMVSKVVEKKERQDCFIIYLNIPRPKRLKRLHDRYQHLDLLKRAEIINSRLDNDDRDFGVDGERFTDFDLCIKNEDF